ncbi:MAG: hypothetical protein ACLUOL_04465 [Faecalibacterium sp.]
MDVSPDDARQDLFHGPPLCAGGEKGSDSQNGEASAFHRRAGGGRAVVLHPPDAQL